MNVSYSGTPFFLIYRKTAFQLLLQQQESYVAMALAHEIAEMAWERRTEFVRELKSIQQALAMAIDLDRKPVIFSEAGDNPGGGGSGRTTKLLSEMIAASAQGVFYGSFFDPALAKDAHVAGIEQIMPNLIAIMEAGLGTLGRPLEVEAEIEV